MGMKFQAIFGTAITILLCLMPNSSQAQTRECINMLLPCSDYINSNRDPPDSCCEPLKYVIEREPECLCSMISVRGANRAERAGVNLTEAQMLPARCGRRINPLGCVIGTPTNSANYQSGRKIEVVILSVIVQVIIWKLLIL